MRVGGASMITCSFGNGKGKKPGQKSCTHDGTERFIGSFWCRQHVPTPAGIHCSHSLAPSGTCAYCGAVVAPAIAVAA